MALTDSFPGPSGLTDSIEAGKDLAGLVAHDADGSPRAGLLVGSATALVTGRSDLRVNIGPFKAALVRNGAVRLIANDGVDQSPTFTIPTANSRIDVLYVKVNEVSQGDASDGPVFGILQGTAATIPQRPTLNIDGAVELATVRLSSADTGTAGATIQQTAPFTAANGGAVFQRDGGFRNLTLSSGTTAALGKTPKITVRNGFAYLEGAVSVAPTGGITVIDADWRPLTDKRFITSDNASFIAARAVTLSASTGVLFSSGSQVVHLDGIMWPVK